MPSWTQHGCKVCNRDERDRAGNLKHEAWCPHFMRGPDAGGDPYEWPTLLDEPDARTISEERARGIARACPVPLLDANSANPLEASIARARNREVKRDD